VVVKMLITDKNTTNRLNERLGEFSKFGMTFHYLLEQGRIAMNEIEEILFSTDDEKSTFRYINILKRVNPSDVTDAFLKYQDDYPKGESTNIEHEAHLNMIYTGKIIDEIVSKCDRCIDKDYINTYNYLLYKEDNNNLNYSYGK